MRFVHLHVHSNYSLLQGAFSVRELAQAAHDNAEVIEHGRWVRISRPIFDALAAALPKEKTQ